jgi:hypothetical protein
MRKALHILLLVLAVAVSCRGPRVIPRGELADVYYDLFIAEQQVRDDPQLYRQADTMLVYEAVFNRYGYDTDDYLHSIRYYLKDPERFAKMMQSVAERLENDAKSLDKVIDHLNWVNRYMGMKRPPLDSLLGPFSDDSLYVGLARVVRDSTRYGGWFRLVPAREDTLMVPADSTRARVDSPAAGKDTAAVEKPAEKPAGIVYKPEAPERRLRPRTLPGEELIEEVEAVEEALEEESE